MKKFFLFIMLVFILVSASSCKAKAVNVVGYIEVGENLSVVKEIATEDLLEILTKEEDLLVLEYTEEVAKEGIKVFNKINAFKEWAQVSTLDFTAENGEGIAKLYYNKDMHVEKMVVRKYDKKQQSLAVYYFKDKNLVLVITQHITYNADLKSKEFSVVESEYMKNCNYFMDGKLFSIISNLDCGAPFAEEYLRVVEKDLLGEVKKLIP